MQSVCYPCLLQLLQELSTISKPTLLLASLSSPEGLLLLSVYSSCVHAAIKSEHGHLSCSMQIPLQQASLPTGLRTALVPLLSTAAKQRVCHVCTC